MKKQEQLPDCMLPDGADYCEGYGALRRKWLADQALFTCLKEDWDKAIAALTEIKTGGLAAHQAAIVASNALGSMGLSGSSPESAEGEK